MKKIIIILFSLISIIFTLSACSHEHVWTEWTTLKEATCTEEGLKERTCECKKTETVLISKISHSWGEWKQDKPCDLYEYIRCIECGEEKEHRIAEKQHNYDSEGFCLDCKEKVYYSFEEVRKIIIVNQVSISQHNSSGIHDLKIVWHNKSEKSVQEIIFNVGYYYNGKEYAKRYSSKSTVESDKQGSGFWDELFPSSGMSSEHIKSVSIKYTDGSTIYIPPISIEYAMKGYGDVKLDGAVYSLLDDGKSYMVTGGYQNNIIIHSTINNKPVVEIESWSFSEDKSIKSIVIEEGITEIGDFAFCLCENLVDVQLPSSITRVGQMAFASTLWEQNQSDGILYVGKALYKYIGEMPSNTDIVVPDGIVSISPYAFEDCKGLTKIYLPSTVVSISRGVFYDCDSLSSIEIAQGNSVYHTDGNCIIETKTKRLIVGCKNSVIPNNESVEVIGEGAFWDCYYLEEITIPDSVKNIEDYAFYDCNKLVTVIIGNGVKEIESCAFKNCEKLAYISIGTGVESIGEQAFYQCYALTNITLSSSLKRIEKAAFKGSNLETMYISNNVEYIGEEAFCLCDFGNIYFDGTKAEWNAIEKDRAWNAYWGFSYVIHCSNGEIKYMN